MPFRPVIHLTVAILGWCYLALPAHAEENRTVALVHTTQTKLAVRLSAELTAQGFQPLIIQSPEALSRASLEAVAADKHAIAVMQIASSGERVSVWLIHRGERLAVLQEVFVPTDRADHDNLLAFKTVELLRASLLVLPEHPPSPSGAAPSSGRADPPKSDDSNVSVQSATSAPVRAEDRAPKPKHLGMLLQPTLAYGFGELTPSFHIDLGLHGRILPRLGVALTGLVPTVPIREDASEGGVDMFVSAVRAQVFATLTPPHRVVDATLGGGVGAVFVKMKGRDAGENVSRDVLVIAALPFIGGGLTVAMNDVVRFRMDVIIGWAAPRPVVRMLDTDVTAWGAPLLCGMMGIDVWLF